MERENIFEKEKQFSVFYSHLPEKINSKLKRKGIDKKSMTDPLSSVSFTKINKNFKKFPLK